MKRKVLILTLVFVFALAGLALAMQHGGHGKGCHYCGMDLKKFENTAMTITYEDGTKMEACSIHCAAVDMAINIDKTPKSITVGDYDSGKMINAEKAYWVVDNSNPGVMTTRAKVAFKKKSNAESYVDANCSGSGQHVNFEEALKAAYEDMYSDTKMIRNKRKMMKKGGMKHGM